VIPLFRFENHSEDLLRKSPRSLEVLCACMLLGVAVLFVAHVVFYEWFYWTYRWAYRYTLEYRIVEWICNLVLLLLTVWMVRTAWSLLRGRSGREDHGLLAPRSLRIWGVVFAVAPIAIVVLVPKVLAHFHILLGFWTAAGACFLLASKRARGPAGGPVAIVVPEGPPPPIE
jgi:hypothetical protein